MAVNITGFNIDGEERKVDYEKGLANKPDNVVVTVEQDTTDGHKLTFKYADGTTKELTIPDNYEIDTNTTYTLTISENKLTLTPSTGEAMSIDIPVQDLSLYAVKTDVPTKLSQLENDVPYAKMSYIVCGTGAGSDSIIFGEDSGAEAKGSFARSIGRNSKATGNYSFASGYGTEASGFYGDAEGNLTVASGETSHAQNDRTTASGSYSHAEGTRTTSSATATHAEGNRTQATGDYAHAENDSAKATGIGSHAEGCGAQANGKYAHAEGMQTRANSKNQHAFGKYNVADDAETYVEIVGNGTKDTERSNARTLDWSGNEVLAGKLTVGAEPTEDKDVATKKYVDGKITEIPSSFQIKSATKTWTITIDDEGTITVTDGTTTKTLATTDDLTVLDGGGAAG